METATHNPVFPTPDEKAVWEARNRVSALQGAGYPKRHILRLAEGLHGPSLEKVRSLYAARRRGMFLFLIGDRGPGKTQMAVWWADQRARSEKAVGRYFKAVDLFGAIKATFGEKGGNSEQKELIDRIKATPFLVLDEISEALGSPWERQVFTNILDHRYDRMLTTILIGNLTVAQAEQAVGASVWSRAQETGGVVLCDWPSYRSQG